MITSDDHGGYDELEIFFFTAVRISRVKLSDLASPTLTEDRGWPVIWPGGDD